MKKYLFLFVTAVSLALFPRAGTCPAVPARDEGRGTARRICERLEIPLESLCPDLPFQDIPKEPTVGS